MDISIKGYGGFGRNPHKIIEMVCDNGSGAVIIADITNTKGFIDTGFISNLREIADELEEQNLLLSKNHH